MNRGTCIEECTILVYLMMLQTHDKLNNKNILTVSKYQVKYVS